MREDVMERLKVDYWAGLWAVTRVVMMGHSMVVHWVVKTVGLKAG